MKTINQLKQRLQQYVKSNMDFMLCSAGALYEELEDIIYDTWQEKSIKQNYYELRKPDGLLEEHNSVMMSLTIYLN